MFAPEDDGPRKVERPPDAHIIKLLRHLFHNCYCPAQDVPENAKHEEELVNLCSWLDDRMDTLGGEAICQELDLPYETWEYLTALVAKRHVADALRPVWFTICLSERLAPDANVRRLVVSILTTFDDGRMSINQGMLSQEMIAHYSPRFDDQTLFTGVYNNLLVPLLAGIVKDGIDGMHAKAEQNKFTSDVIMEADPFDVLMGAISHIIPQLKPEYRTAVRNYANLFHQIVRPPLPDHLLHALKRKQKLEQAAEEGKTHGGWDVHE